MRLGPVKARFGLECDLVPDQKNGQQRRKDKVSDYGHNLVSEARVRAVVMHHRRLPSAVPMLFARRAPAHWTWVFLALDMSIGSWRPHGRRADRQ